MRSHKQNWELSNILVQIFKGLYSLSHKVDKTEEISTGYANGKSCLSKWSPVTTELDKTFR